MEQLPHPDASMFDVAVIGGGVNGTGIARDAAGRGARVLLLEAQDLASGTSSNSSKLIHGGLRYLEHYEFGLVREALGEREILWAIAPHIIWPMRFVLPWVKGLRPRWMLRLGLFLYDHIGMRKLLLATETIRLDRHPAGKPLKPEFRHGFVYSDGWVDDARLVVLNARDAADRGAEVHTRCPMTKLERVYDHWRIDTPKGVFAARSIINAAGPSVLSVLGRSGEQPKQSIRLVRGSHIVVRKLFDHPFPYFFQLPDGRIFFAIPYEQDFTLIGTTDRDQQAGEPIVASEEEIAYLCEGASRFFAKPVTPADVVWTYSGVRPLVDDGSGKPEAATRGYRFDLTAENEGAPMLSVFGGKITTFRTLSQEAVDKLASRIPALRGDHWTHASPLPGGDFHVDEAPLQIADLRKRYPFLEQGWAERLVRSYGTIAARFLGEAKTLADCGEHFGHGLTEAEVRHLMANEWAMTAEDILWRRTKLGLHLSSEQQAALERYFQKEPVA
ncbi:homodimeric glycerol 3-phosphate dehydrogenase (quinone) [Blastomonas natatoria]|uniref:Glycerol-3-phosphate dehydrogenase n=1 Tax=Blastomonas natatoria TaxID=34015 RepID=A0A2V3VEA3_9SPHN|nr:glycerol-3-phosphate dehydrogenase [Blastomonas natatoria]PXW78385.1 homodimeric glycerol 3-phosphate dehydrogenase (quinone) [Blastomonas natatoria]